MLAALDTFFLSTYLSKNICIRQDICQIKTIPCKHWKLTKWWIASSNTVFFTKMNCLNSQFPAPFQDRALCTEFLLRIAHANSKTLEHCINTSKICLSEHKSAKQCFLGQITWVSRLKNVWFIPPQKNCRNHSSIVINSI